MNLLRQLALVATSSALCLAFAPGCGPKKPDGTNPPTEGGKKKKKRAGKSGGDDGGTVAAADGGAADGGDGGAPEKCEAKVADPALLFGSSILIRPPHGVEFQPDDGNPTFASAVMSGGGFISSCDATVKRVLVFVYPNDKQKGLAGTLDEFVESLASQGYANGTSRGVKHDGGGEKHVAYDFPAQVGNQATSLYIVAAERTGATVPPIEKIDNVFIVVYESSPEEYGLLEPSFKESGSSLFIVPPD